MGIYIAPLLLFKGWARRCQASFPVQVLLGLIFMFISLLIVSYIIHDLNIGELKTYSYHVIKASNIYKVIFSAAS